MVQPTQGRLAGQVRRARGPLLADQDLCLHRLLPVEQVTQALEHHRVKFRQRLYTPLVTLWVFLYQVLSADQSCRAAVARLLARLGVQGAGPASAKTDPYCKARQRLAALNWARLPRRCLNSRTACGSDGLRPITAPNVNCSKSSV